MRNEIFKTKVEGMICPQCEDEIAQKLLHTRGIVSCNASYRKNQITAEYDREIISEKDISVLLSNMGYPVGDGKSGRKADTIALLSVVILYFLIPYVTNLVNVPSLESGASFGSLFLIGILTGVHCIGMCGGIMLSQHSVILYNTGRILSYTFMGAIFGLVGKIIAYDTEMKSMLFTLCGLLVVLTGLKMWGVSFLRQISPELTKPCRFKGKAFSVGMLTGIMPCGALTSMWMFASSSGSWYTGALSMFSFGLGTCVFMVLFGAVGLFIPKKYNRYLLKGSTVLIVTLGLILMTKGLKLILI